MSMPDFESLKDVFKKFVSDKYDMNDITGRVIRSAAVGGKEAVRHGLQEFPKAFVDQAVRDLYDLVSSQDLADSVSGIVRSFDEEKVTEIVESLTASLKDRDAALQLAAKIKDILDKTGGADGLTAQLDALMGMSDIPPMGKILFSTFLNQAGPILEDMKGSSDEEIADKIMELADAIPSDMIAAQVAALTSQVTPDRISKQAHDFIGQLPAPQTVADIVHTIGDAAQSRLDDLSKISDPSQMSGILRDFAQDASDIIGGKVNEDKRNKRDFKKGPGGFDL